MVNIYAYIFIGIVISFVIGLLIERADVVYYMLRTYILKRFSCPEVMWKLKKHYGSPLIYITLSKERNNCVISFEDNLFICGNTYPLSQLKSIIINGYDKNTGCFTETTEVKFEIGDQNISINTIRTLLNQYDYYLLLGILRDYKLRQKAIEENKERIQNEQNRNRAIADKKKRENELKLQKEIDLQERMKKPIITISNNESESDDGSTTHIR